MDKIDISGVSNTDVELEFGKIDFLFNSCNTSRNGKINGNEAVKFFPRFGLPDSDLAILWNKFSEHGVLSRKSFTTILKYIFQRIITLRQKYYCTKSKKKEYVELFKNLSKWNDNYVESTVIQKILLQSKLPNTDLKQIWDISALNPSSKAGKMIEEDFCIAMTLTNKKLVDKNFIFPDIRLKKMNLPSTINNNNNMKSTIPLKNAQQIILPMTSPIIPMTSEMVNVKENEKLKKEIDRLKQKLEESKKMFNEKIKLIEKEKDSKIVKYKNKIKILEENKSKVIMSSKNSDEENLIHKIYEINKSEVLLMKKIGSGGFGKCYLSKWIGSGGDVDVVVKVIDFEGIKVTSKKVFDEIKVQLHIRNPSICRIYGFSLPTPSKVYIVMEKMDYDVNKMIKNNKLTLNEKLKIMEKMTQSVQVIHSKNILHRDLKCANFLANKSGNIKLTDFGIATVMTHSQTHIQSGGKGSLPWMDPILIDDENDILEEHENVRNDAKMFSKETDMYSLGCCFFEVLFEKEPYIIMNGKFQKMAKKITKVPKEVIEKVLLCIDDDKDERPTASELLKWFKRYNKNK